MIKELNSQLKAANEEKKIRIMQLEKKAELKKAQNLADMQLLNSAEERKLLVQAFCEDTGGGDSSKRKPSSQ